MKQKTKEVLFYKTSEIVLHYLEEPVLNNLLIISEIRSNVSIVLVNERVEG